MKGSDLVPSAFPFELRRPEKVTRLFKMEKYSEWEEGCIFIVRLFRAQIES